MASSTGGQTVAPLMAISACIDCAAEFVRPGGELSRVEEQHFQDAAKGGSGIPRGRAL